MDVKSLKALTLREGLVLDTKATKEVLISKLILHFTPPVDPATDPLDTAVKASRKAKPGAAPGVLAPVFTALKQAAENGQTIPGVTLKVWDNKQGLTVKPTGEPITGKGRAVFANLQAAHAGNGMTLGFFTLRASGYLMTGAK